MEWYPCSYSGGDLDSLLDTHGVSPEAQTFPADRGIPFSGTIGNQGTTSMVEFAMSHKSGFYTVYLNGKWHNFLNLRHRNGYGDGSGYGIFFYSVMTGKPTIDIDLVWRQQTGADSWGLEKILLDSNNYKRLVFDFEHGNEINIAGNLASRNTDYAWINYRDKITDTATSKPIEKYILGNGATARAGLECKYLLINDMPENIDIADLTYLISWSGGALRSVGKRNFIQAKLSSGYYGMCFDNYQDNGWIRTTSLGLLPYQAGDLNNGHSSLGSPSWYFLNAYIEHIHSTDMIITTLYTSKITKNNTDIIKIIFNVNTLELNAFYPDTGFGNSIYFKLYANNNQSSIQRYARLATYGSSTDLYFEPDANNVMVIGSATNKIKQFYGVTASISTSDRNQKKDVSYIGKSSKYDTYMDDETCLEFIKGLQPCIYRLIENDSNRPHHGLIAQDIEELLQKLGIKDHAAFIKSPKTETIEIEEEVEEEYVDEADGQTKTRTVIRKKEEQREIPGEYVYGLRYEEFTADIIRFVQILYNRNTDLETALEEQKERTESLEKRIEVLENIIKQTV